MQYYPDIPVISGSDTKGKKKPEETEIQCVTSRRVTTTTTTARVCEVTQCCCEGKRELYGCALSNCGSVAAWQHGSPLPTTP